MKRIVIVGWAVLAMAGCSITADGQSTAAGPSGGRPLPKPPIIDVSRAPAPLYDDPVWHGASDPVVVWMPSKGQKGEFWMYYTQRRASLTPKNGVDWVHGSAIGIATSTDGLNWTYKGVAKGDMDLGDPMKNRITWWAPTLFWEKGRDMGGGEGLGGGRDDRFHMFVTRVHGIFTSWTGDRTIEHFVSPDGENFTHVSTLPLASMRCIDPSVYRIDGTWYLWYKNEAAGSRTFMARSKDLNTWEDVGEVIGGQGHEAPFVWKWKGAYWMINDAHGRGMDVYRSETGTGNWVRNTTLLADREGRRPLDNNVGHHPWVWLQDTGGGPGHEQLVLFYFTHARAPNGANTDRTYMQMAEITMGDDGRLVCDRNKFLATTPPAAAPGGNPVP